MDTFATLFILTFAAFFVLAVLYGIHVEEHRPLPPEEVAPFDTHYQGFYLSLLAEVGKVNDDL